MDYRPCRCGRCEDGGFRRLTRLSAAYDGHTYVYQFADEDAERAGNMIRLHVEEGQLHPYAGLLLLRMLKHDK